MTAPNRSGGQQPAPDRPTQDGSAREPSAENRPVEDRWVAVRPHDTVQVRDGRTFDAGTGGIAHSVRPWPSTIAGALSAALGGDPESVRGPVLCRETGDQWEAYLPAPADLVTDPDRQDVRRMHLPDEPASGTPSGAEPLTDLHDAEVAEEERPEGLRLPTVPDGAEDTEPLEALVPAQVLEAYLHGELVPAGGLTSIGDLDEADDPVVPERRIGVGLDPDTKTVRNGQLYRTTHLRLERGWAFAAHVTPRPDQQDRVDGGVGAPVRFGGLARMADVDPAPGAAWPRPPQAFPGGRLLLYVATPALWEQGWYPPLPHGAELVSAVVGDPMPVATASPGLSPDQYRRQRVLSWAVPPGSVYLLAFPGAGEAAAWAAEHHARALGPPARPRLDTAGFGVVLTGVWS